nr:hypothetical protein [Tanacetum cinerariifolium]
MNMGQDRQMHMIGVQNVGNQVAQNPRVQNVGNQNGLIEARIQLQAEEYDLMAAAADFDEIKEVNANCILMANLQQALSSGTQTDSTPVYDSDGSAENDNNVISEVTDVEKGGETVEQHSVNFEETRALYDSLYQNLAVEVEKVNSVNRKLKETNADLTTELASINGKQYILVIVDDYSRYTWVHFLRSKDEALAVIITFLKRITVLLQSPVIIISTDNDTEFKNQVLKVYFDPVGISHQMSSIRTPQQNGVVKRRNRTLVEAARTMLIFSRAPLFLWVAAIATACLTQNRSIIHRRFNKTPYELINGRKLDISFLHVFGALCYPKNDREDIGKLGAKETMNASFDELSAMAFEQRSSKPRLQCMTSGQISSGLDLTYAPSTITKQQPTEDNVLIPTNSSSHATNIPITSQDVDELNQNAMVDVNMFVNPFATSSSNAAEISSL